MRWRSRPGNSRRKLRRSLTPSSAAIPLHFSITLRRSFTSVGKVMLIFLDRGVHGDLTLLGVVTIKANRDLENQARLVLADAPPEIGEVGVVAGKFPLEMTLATEGLVVGILDQSIDDALVAQVVELFEDHKPHHEPDRLGRTPMFAVEVGKCLLESFPGDGSSKFEQWIPGIELIDEILVEEIALIIPGCPGLHGNLRPGDNTTVFLRSHCVSWSRMIH